MVRPMFSVVFVAVAMLMPELNQGATVPFTSAVLRANSGHLTYIGSMRSSSNQISGGPSVKATSFYFQSQNAAAYTNAASDCRASLGDDATLLQIETEEELAAVIKFIRETDDTGSSYWVGGRYDPDRKTFVWENNDEEIGSWAPWDQGHPNTRTQLTRVFARTVGNLKLRTQFNTVSTRYICELQV